MTRAEEEAVWYAESVNWDYNEICEYIFNNMNHTRYSELIGNTANEKAHYIINKFKPKMETKTKVMVLGEEPKKELKKIEVTHFLREDAKEIYKIAHTVKLDEYKEVILISKNYAEGLDIILGKHEGNEDVLFFGKWNDGIV